MKKTYLKITGSGCSWFKLALHAAFHARIHQKLEAVEDKTVINLTEADIEEYGESIEAENDLSRNPRRSSKTEEKSDIDEQRDSLVSFAQNQVTNGKNAPVEKMRTASKTLAPVMDAYKGIQKEADNAETQLIRGMIKDLRKEEYATHVTALGLDEVIDELERVNNEFDALQAERTDVKVKKGEVPGSREQRAWTDDMFQQICAIVFAAQLTCTDAEKLKVIEQLIRDFNGIIDEFRTSYNKSKGIRKPSKPDESDRPVIPDGGDGTDEPEEPEEKPDEGEGGEDDRPEIPDETDDGKEEPGKDENGDDLPPIE